MTEPQLVLKIRKAIDARYGDRVYIRKIHGGRYSSGIPDLIGSATRHRDDEGFFFAFEVKLPGKERNVTKLQQSNLDAIDKAGGYFAVVTSVKAAIDFMEGWLK